MIALLDAHVLIWALTDHRRLSKDARAAIKDPANDVLVSAATAWELSIKQASGKLKLSAPLLEGVEAAGFSWLPIMPGDAIAAAALPVHHRDPFDRMLVAQAKRLDAILVTRDRNLADYGVEVLPA